MADDDEAEAEAEEDDEEGGGGEGGGEAAVRVLRTVKTANRMRLCVRNSIMMKFWKGRGSNRGYM